MSKIKDAVLTIGIYVGAWTHTIRFVFRVVMFQWASSESNYLKMKRSGEKLYDWIRVKGGKSKNEKAKSLVSGLYCKLTNVKEQNN